MLFASQPRSHHLMWDTPGKGLQSILFFFVQDSTIAALVSTSAIPTVEITAPIPEEEMVTKVEEIVIPSTFVEEINDEKLVNGPTNEVKVVLIETDEEVTQCGCAEVLENGLQKVKTAIEEIPPEYKEAARYSGLVTASVVGLFFSVILYRISQHLLFGEEQGVFCSYFSRPFAPMFDALCHPEYPGIFSDFVQESQHLFKQVESGIGNFFGSIFAGFRAFGTIFWALFGGIFHVISDGVGELFENVRENVTFLCKFICDFASSIFGIFYRMLTGTIYQLGIAISNFGKVVLGEPTSSSGWFQ